MKEVDVELPVQNLNVHYVVDGAVTLIPTKLFYAPNESDDSEMTNAYLELYIDNLGMVSASHYYLEYAIANLQLALSEGTNIACCQSCRHGNFCPFGDSKNEIFCLKHLAPNSKNDVCKFFTNNDYGKFSRKLLDYCKDYKPISHDEYYTYNDWEL